jgi:predicted transglutaminase-like cysteine proteinase
MVPIRLCPFPRKRVVGFIALAFLALSVVGCFADPVLLSVKTTPYDRQMARIQPVLASAVAPDLAQQLPLRLINRWIGELRDIPYGYSLQWKTPAEVAREPVADCKGKAVALYQQMIQHGARGLKLVIGRRAPTSRSTHTWIQWTTASTTYILDPTINWTAQTVDEIADNSYVPYYVYSGGQKYRAPAASALFARL